jgi:hypothetical protein
VIEELGRVARSGLLVEVGRTVERLPEALTGVLGRHEPGEPSADVSRDEARYPALEDIVDERPVVPEDVAVAAAGDPGVDVVPDVVDEDGAACIVPTQQVERVAAQSDLVGGAVFPRGDDDVEPVTERVMPGDDVEEIGVDRDQRLPLTARSSARQRGVDGGVEGQRAAQFEHAVMHLVRRGVEEAGEVGRDLAGRQPARVPALS